MSEVIRALAEARRIGEEPFDREVCARHLQAAAMESWRWRRPGDRGRMAGPVNATLDVVSELPGGTLTQP